MAKNGKRLFVDMDGVLAVFNNNISSTEELYAKGYFRDLKPQTNVVEAVKKLIADNKMEVYILSAYLADSEYALKEKNEWLDEFLPELKKENRMFVTCTQDKKEAIKDLDDNDFLLDDYTHNLLLWQPPARGIKLLNDINHTKGSWMHDRINYNRNADDLAAAITDVVCNDKHIFDEKTPRKQKEQEVKASEIKDGGLTEVIEEKKKHLREGSKDKKEKKHKDISKNTSRNHND